MPDNCENHQFCRNFASRRDIGKNEVGGDPTKANYVFQIMFWSNIAFIIIDAILIIVLLSMEREEKEEKVKFKKPTPWTVILLVLSSFLLALALVFYIPFVFFNFTFTHNDLPDDNIPYYINDESAFMNIEEGDSGRFGLYWWVYASDAILFLVPIVTLANLGCKIHLNLNFTVLVQLELIVLLVLQIVKFIWGALLALPTLCDGHQFCRAFGSRRDNTKAEVGDNPRNMNYVYSLYVWFNLGFSLILFVTLIVVSFMKGALFRGTVKRMFAGYQSLTGTEESKPLLSKKEKRISNKNKIKT